MTATQSEVRGFLSPFEVPAPEGCEGWESMYPYYALFSEERRESEEARGWFRDGMHFPEPMFPFDFVTADSPDMCLGQANSRIFAVPPALGIDHRVLYGWVYMSANPVTDPAEIGRRAELFGARAGFYFQNWDELYARWRGKVEETIGELEALQVPDLPDIEDEAVVTEGRGLGATHTLLVAYNRPLESVLGRQPVGLEPLAGGHAHSRRRGVLGTAPAVLGRRVAHRQGAFQREPAHRLGRLRAKHDP